MANEFLPFLRTITQEVLPWLYDTETLTTLNSWNNVSYWNGLENNGADCCITIDMDDFTFWSNVSGLRTTNWFNEQVVPYDNNTGLLGIAFDQIIDPEAFWKAYSYSDKIFDNPSQG